MPLPGGPSDKVGNRYELRWIVRQLVDLVTGRLLWLRVEPPGEDAIEFRCRSARGEFAYQVKRGISGGGHWTLSALSEVLDGFGALLGAEPELRCVFASSHAAPELEEMAERARASRDTVEFTKVFLEAKWLEKAWAYLQNRWGVDQVETWHRLRRISVATTGEGELQENTEAILQLLFDAPPETTRAVLTDFALESVHREVVADDVLKRLAEHSIHRIPATSGRAIAPTLSPPPASGLRRDAELARIAGLAGGGKATIVVGGISGIGKTTVVAQFAAEWSGPVCWLDAELLSSPAEAIAVLGEFLTKSFADNSVAQAIPKAEQVAAVGRLAGKVLAANRCLVVWDGVDGDRQAQLRPVIDAIAATISGGGVQLVTAQETWGTGKTSTAQLHVSGLDRTTIRRVLTEAFPDARTADVEAAHELTQGHPYLMQLLIDAANIVDLGTALRATRTEDRAEALVSAVVGRLAEGSRKLLASLTWLEIPFRSDIVDRLGGTAATLRELAARHLVVYSGGNTYRVHDLVAHLVKAATRAQARVQFHERAALLLRTLDKPSWLEVRAVLRHARAASMSDVAHEAGVLLLRYATDGGLWWLAREAAENLAPTSVDFFPHFILGKCYRMTGELDKALTEYELAETHASTPEEREVARYERASVLCELGRRTEADPLYTEMLDSAEPTTRSNARIALALGLMEQGEHASALHMLEEALQIVTEASAQREISEVHHAIARVLIRTEEWQRAREHIRRAYEVRFDIKGLAVFDAIGWFQLYQSVLQIERALGNREGARSAAHGLWRYAILSGSIPWEASAAIALCLADRNEKDQEVTAALARLRAVSADRGASVSLRVSALKSLVLCEWSLRHHEAAVEANLELLAIANEEDIDVPVFGHATTEKEHDENVGHMPWGYVLFLPPHESLEFFNGIVARILERRPELIQHARGVVGRVKQNRKRAKAPSNANKRKKKGAPRRKRR